MRLRRAVVAVFVYHQSLISLIRIATIHDMLSHIHLAPLVTSVSVTHRVARKATLDPLYPPLTPKMASFFLIAGKSTCRQ